MKFTRRSNDISILEMDFSDIKNDIEKWMKRRERQTNIFDIYTMMINDLEALLLVSEGIDILKIKLQILRLKIKREDFRRSGFFEVKLEVREKHPKRIKQKVLNIRNEE